MPLSKYVEELYDESEKRESWGICPRCEDDYFSDDEPEPLDEHVLCYVCGVCFKYHHDENFCDPIPDEVQVP